MKSRKLSFKALDLSKHPIKNLQSTINIISDKENDQEEADNLSEVLTHQSSFVSRIFSRTSENNKGKGQESNSYNPCKIRPKVKQEGDGDNNSSSSSEDEPARRDT